MRSMKKPERPTQRLIYVPKSMWKAVRAAAKAEYVSMSEWVRRQIAKGLPK